MNVRNSCFRWLDTWTYSVKSFHGSSRFVGYAQTCPTTLTLTLPLRPTPLPPSTARFVLESRDTYVKMAAFCRHRPGKKIFYLAFGLELNVISGEIKQLDVRAD